MKKGGIGVLIRQYQESDMQPCIELFIEVFNQPPWNNQWTNAMTENLFEDFYNTPGFLVYVAVNKSQEIIGALIGKEKQWWSGKEYFIEEFFVKTELQGQGIGSKMLDYVYEDIQTKGIGTVTLLTNTFAPAYNFYMNKGYKENPTLRFLHKNL